MTQQDQLINLSFKDYYRFKKTYVESTYLSKNKNPTNINLLVNKCNCATKKIVNTHARNAWQSLKGDLYGNSHKEFQYPPT